MNEFPLLDPNNGIPLFYPHIPKKAIEYVNDTLRSRWLGQGPKVEQFERTFEEKFLVDHATVSVLPAFLTNRQAYGLFLSAYSVK